MSAKLKIILSMTAFGTLSLFVRRIPLSSAEVALFRAVIALLALGGAKTLGKKGLSQALARPREGESWRAAPERGRLLSPLILFLSGAAMGFNWIFLFEAYKYTTVSVATLSYYFAPVLVTLACPLLFHERMTARNVVCFVGSTVGLMLVVNPGALAGPDPVRGVLFGLAAAALYATVVLLNKKITDYSGIDRTVLQFGAAALVLLPYVLLSGGFHFARMDAAGWACLMAVGLIHSALAYVLYFSALKSLPGHEAAILSYIDPLVAVIVSLVVLRESVAPFQLVGGAMILAFTLWDELRR